MLETRIWLADCERMLHKYAGHHSHANKVARLADRLFTAMSHTHGLDEQERAALVAAAFLHDIGHVIDSRKHHRHSQYLIQHDALLSDWPSGFRERVALLALNHRKAEVKGLKGYDKLTRAVITAQVAILRLADWLDRPRDHRVDVMEVVQDAEGAGLTVQLEGIESLELVVCAERKAGLAATVFGLPLRFVCDDQTVQVLPCL